MFDRGPLTHIRADGGQDVLSRQDIHAIHLGQFDSSDTIQRLCQVNKMRVVLRPSGLARGGRRSIGLGIGFEQVIQLFERLIASPELLAIEIVQFEGLLLGKEMLGFEMAFQRFDNF